MFSRRLREGKNQFQIAEKHACTSRPFGRLSRQHSICAAQQHLRVTFPVRDANISMQAMRQHHPVFNPPGSVLADSERSIYKLVDEFSKLVGGRVSSLMPLLGILINWDSYSLRK